MGSKIFRGRSISPSESKKKELKPELESTQEAITNPSASGKKPRMLLYNNYTTPGRLAGP